MNKMLKKEFLDKKKSVNYLQTTTDFFKYVMNSNVYMYLKKSK